MESTPDFGSIISTLSSNPALMGMISELMKNTAPPRPDPPPQPQMQRAETNGAFGANGIDPRLLGTLASFLSQGSPNNTEPKNTVAQLQAPQENTENILSKLLGDRSESENRVRLLNALRPYLSEDRREKLDLILKLLKLAELGHLSGLLKTV